MLAIVHRRLLLAVVVAALFAGAPPVASASSGLELHPCKNLPHAVCGHIRRLVDPAHPSHGKIKISFELHLARNEKKPPKGTIVAVEGGPGYSSRASRDYYLDLFKPLRRRYQLLIVDNRGTGRSAAIDCPALQSYEGDYLANVKMCGKQLGRDSDVWGTAFAADDMAAVLDALGIERVDLYGDSYGTFFGQTFAVRHPDRIRTVTLDAAYPAEGLDPWYRDENRAVVDSFERVCDRDPDCAALGGDLVERIRVLADALAKSPLTGVARDADAKLHEVTVDAPFLGYIAAVSTYIPPVYAELDAAASAYLDDGDPAPLLRIAAEQTYWGDAGDVIEYSEGLYIAVACNDYPQLWDITAPKSDRRSQYRSAVDSLKVADPDGFYPFTVPEWLHSPWNESVYKACLGWPSPSNWVPAIPAFASYPNAPTLVLVGDLDSITSPEGAATVASRFPNSTFVLVRNQFHVTALADYSRCASDIVVRFVRSGGDTGDTSCAADYNEVRVSEQFPTHLADVAAAPGSGPGPRARSITASASTVADVITRWWDMYGYKGAGLRGGRFTTTGYNHVKFSMTNLRWVDDLKVDGNVTWDRTTGAIEATVHLTGASHGDLTLRWNDWDSLAIATVKGTVDGKHVNRSFPAP
jgi:pimeloyl-ACP methyl ester carboxylesterase